MSPRKWPHPQEWLARRYRRAHEAWDREPVGRLERAGFGDLEGLQGDYARRPAYWRTRGELQRPRPVGSGWPHGVHELTPEQEERHLRAFRDRDLARAVDFALYNAIGPAADRIAVYAKDAVITLAGVVPDRAYAREAVATARAIPGVRRVRNGLRTMRGGVGPQLH
ncbi:MAG TPA: BON domain-containing protein [Longimicrobiales bacterium]|nr:BON domain-containing protein [Longimicrobiales bacterium]